MKNLIKGFLIYLLILIVVLQFFVLDAQNLKSSIPVYVYTQLPLTPFDSSVVTYSSNMSTGPVELKNKESVEGNYLIIEGYEKVADDGDVVINVKLKGLTVISKKEKSYEFKVKKGDVEQKKTKYSYDVEVSFPLTVIVNDKNGEEIYYREIHSSSDKMIRSFYGEYYSSRALQSAYSNKKMKFLEGIEQSILNEGLKSIKRSLESLFAFAGKKTRLKIFYVKSKKADYEDLVKAKDLITEAAELNNNEAPKEKVNEKFNEAITIWKKAMEEYDPNSKKARINEKVMGILEYNSAVIYMWLNDFESAKKYLALANELKGTKKYTMGYKSIIKDHEKRYLANQ